MQCYFRAQKMADGSTRNFNTGKDLGQFPIQSAQILTACG